MKLQSALLAAAALAIPAQAMAEPLCAVLQAVKPVAEKDKWMAALKTGQPVDQEWVAARQIDGFKCVVTIGTTPTMTRGFYNCTWAGPKNAAPVQATLDAIEKCFGVKPVVEKKSYTTTTLFDLRKQPHMWVAANLFTSGSFSFSLIAE